MVPSLKQRHMAFSFNLSIVAMVLNTVIFVFSFLESGHFPLATDKDLTGEMSGERDTSHWR